MAQNDILQKMFGLQQATVNKQNALADIAEQLPTAAADNAQTGYGRVSGQLSQADLSPLMAFADSMTGGHTAQAYRKPPSSDERLETIAKLRTLAGQGQQALTKDMLTQMLGGDKLQALLMANLSKQGKTDDARTDRVIRQTDKVFKDIEKDDIIKVGRQNQASVRKGLELLNDPSLPVTPQIAFNITNDNANAQNFRGSNGATDFKLSGEEIKTARSEVAKLLQKYGGDSEVDLRKVDPTTVNLLHKISSKLDQGYNTTLGKEHQRFFNAYKAARKGSQMHLDALQGVQDELMDSNPEWFKAADEAKVNEKKNRNPQTTMGAGVQVPAGGTPIPAKPAKVSDSDWAIATPEEKAALSNHFK